MGASCNAMRKISVDFADTAPWRFVTETEINATPSEVFNVMILDDSALNKWHPEVSDVNWLTPQPHQAGSKRTVRFTHILFVVLLMGSLVLSEEFLVWEENKRVTFRFNSTNRPVFLGYRAGMEDFQLEELPNGKTKFTRVVAVEPSVITSLLGCIVKPTFQRIFNRAAENLSKQFQTEK